MQWKKGLIIFLCSVLAAGAVMFGMSDKSDAKAGTYYEDIERFPASYRNALYALKENHPNWTFEVMYTGLDWNEVIYNEMNPAHRSLIPSYFDSSFVGAYYGDGWSCATQTAVEYYLDPRNWLTEDYIFQFEKLTYNGNTQGIATVQKVLANTFMSGYIEGYESIGLTYAQAFRDIGASIGVSPVHLATRVYQEQGAKGSSDLISGTYPGYEGYYNYYNIQATGKEHEEIVRNGLNEAKSEGWNNRYAALFGGSKKVSERYILRGQDTLYLQKFDVDGTYDGRYWHQYMQNLVAPSNEGRNIKRAYEKAGMLNEAFVFKIPVYNNMPNEVNEEYTQAFVERLYTLVLGRQCSEEESKGWINALNKNAISCTEVAYGFIFSEEFLSKKVSKNEFISILYQTMLNRTAAEEEIQGWLDAFVAGNYSRKFIFQQFATAPEFERLCSKYGLAVGSIFVDESEMYGDGEDESKEEPTTEEPSTEEPTEPNEQPSAPSFSEGIDGFVERLYYYVLGRICDSTEMRGWSDGLATGIITPQEAVHGFFNSEEFISYNYNNTEFVKILYRCMLAREGSDAEMEGWITYLDSTGDKKYIIDGFLNSYEFGEIMEQYGLK